MALSDQKLYYVGGVVRDEILGLPSLDTDFCYEGDAIEFSKNLNVVRANPDFGTVRVLIDEEEIDIASTRKEIYPIAGHLPVVEKIGCDLKDDLARRDFTINAMAKNTVTGELVDYFGGLHDLELKKIRVLHEKSFIDDPSRILRGLKFCVRFGFELDEETEFLQKSYLKNINYDMSYHRLKKELKETFNLNNQEAYERFLSQEIYRLLGENQNYIEPKCNISELINKYSPEHVWLVYLGCFDLKNFELSREEQDIVESYKKIRFNIPNSKKEIYDLFNNIPVESVLLYASFVDYNVANEYLMNLRDIKISITGSDLISLGINQGKIFREIFDYLLKQLLENPRLTKEDEILIVKSRFL